MQSKAEKESERYAEAYTAGMVFGLDGDTGTTAIQDSLRREESIHCLHLPANPLPPHPNHLICFSCTST